MTSLRIQAIIVDEDGDVELVTKCSQSFVQWNNQEVKDKKDVFTAIGRRREGMR